jgi:hypothetical protein
MPDSQSLPDHSAAAVWGDGTPTLAEAERARTEALQAENDRLRAALEETAGAFSAWSGARRDAMKYGGSSAREYDRLVRAMIAAWLGDDCPHRDREDGLYCGAPMNRCGAENRLELVGARCDVETVERLRQSYEGQVDGMSNIEQTHGRGTRWIALRAALVPPLDESDLRAALADTAVEVEFVPAPPEGAVSALERIRDWDLDPMDDAEYVWDELRKIAVEVIGPRPATKRGQ